MLKEDFTGRVFQQFEEFTSEGFAPVFPSFEIRSRNIRSQTRLLRSTMS